MAQFEINGFESLLAKLDQMGKFDDVAPKMMDAGMEILQESVVAAAEEHHDTGAMAASVKKTGLSKTGSGAYYMCTRPTGVDKKGIRNMEKMVWLEYGVKGRPATPVMTKAVIRAEPGVIEAMRNVFYREVGE